jgi:hypothetical protein
LLTVVLAGLTIVGDECGVARAGGAVRRPLTSGPAPPFDEAGYWAIADRLQARFEPLWSERDGRYRAVGGGCETMINALELLTHSVAARAGVGGRVRNDARARQIARTLVSPPVFIAHSPPRSANGTSLHAPGWSSSMSGGTGDAHEVFDAEIVDGLVAAWRARRELDLPVSTARLIAARIHSVARSRFWRWPAGARNQINWYALIYAADATVSGRPRAIATPMRRQLARFLRGIVDHPRGTAGNLGPSLRFHYVPEGPVNDPRNVESTEYANIALSFARFYHQARRAGMRAPAPAGRALLRAWVRRVLAGGWTHAGYLNWDSGLGFDRWHQAKKLGLTQQALLGVAQARELQPTAAWGRWAKWLLDRSLAWYARQPTRIGGFPDAVFFGLSEVPQSVGSAALAAARVQANAARAIEAGLGRKPAAVPPALYAYDPDIGRLAVTTHAYNTAIVAVNQRAFPYGGIELARLFDGEQRVAANVGGTGAAAFGVRVRDAAGRPVLSSQTARAAVDPAVTPLRLTRAPSGIGAPAGSRRPRAYAGRFTKLEATGSVAAPRARVTATHRFTPREIATTWTVARRRGAGPLSADVQFPSWGADARVVAVLRDGTRRRLGGRALPLAKVDRFEVESERSGYAVIPLVRPARAVATLRRPAPQSSQPSPGPTLVVAVARRARFRHVRFAARIVPGLSHTIPPD